MSGFLSSISPAYSLLKGQSSAAGASNRGNQAGLSAKLGKTGLSNSQIPNLSPEQMKLFQHLTGQLGKQGGNLAQGLGLTGQLAAGSQEGFDQYEAPAKRQFSELAGQLSSRFSGAGSGSRNSSGFQNSLAGEAGSLAERLGANRMGLQRQALQDLFGLHNQLMGTQTYENVLTPNKPKSNLWGNIAGAALPIAGAGIGGLFGGPAGAALGGQIGGSAAQGFFG